MKVWITRYALTGGIYTRDCEVVDSKIVAYSDEYYQKPDWHETEEAAKAKAEQMRLREIAKLKKQIEKLEKMKF